MGSDPTSPPAAAASQESTAPGGAGPGLQLFLLRVSAARLVRLPRKASWELKFSVLPSPRPNRNSRTTFPIVASRAAWVPGRRLCPPVSRRLVQVAIAARWGGWEACVGKGPAAPRGGGAQAAARWGLGAAPCAASGAWGGAVLRGAVTAAGGSWGADAGPREQAGGPRDCSGGGGGAWGAGWGAKAAEVPQGLDRVSVKLGYVSVFGANGMKESFAVPRCWRAQGIRCHVLV